MSDRCITPEELAELSADDPRRGHVDGCPRCQAVMKSFVAFMDPADIPGAADLADAQRIQNKAMCPGTIRLVKMFYLNGRRAANHSQ